MSAPLPERFVYDPPLIPRLSVIYADAELIVLNKPSGLLSVAGKNPGLEDCLEARAREVFPTAAMVHRLDKDTSGVLLMALNKPALAFLGRQFETRKTEKSYMARVAGRLTPAEGLVDLPLATNWEQKPRQKVDYELGRPSQTRWRVLTHEADATRVRLTPITGRTHQLRVHMLALGHPILGDAFYAPPEILAAADRLQLHAEELTIAHPSDGIMRHFMVPCPF